MRGIQALSLLPSWSNARDVKTLAKEMYASATRGKTSDGKHNRTLSAEQALVCTKSMVAMRLERCNHQEGNSSPGGGRVASQQLGFAELPTAVHHEPLACDTYAESSDPSAHITQQHAQNALCVLNATIAPSRRQPSEDAGATRDAGVPDAIWDQLQVDKENQESRQEKMGQEARRKDEATQEKIRQMGNCPAGYDWIQQSGGYRCSGGSHFISDAQLGED